MVRKEGLNWKEKEQWVAPSFSFLLSSSSASVDTRKELMKGYGRYCPPISALLLEWHRLLSVFEAFWFKWQVASCGSLCPWLINHRHNILILYLLWILLDSYTLWAHWNPVLTGHWKHYKWGVKEQQTHISCVSPLLTFMLHCHSRLCLQNTRCQQQSMHPSSGSFCAWDPVWLYRSHFDSTLSTVFLQHASCSVFCVIDSAHLSWGFQWYLLDSYFHGPGPYFILADPSHHGHSQLSEQKSHHIAFHLKILS